MRNRLIGKGVTIAPLEGESDVDRELTGRIEDKISRKEFRGAKEYYIVKLDSALKYTHPALGTPLSIDRVLVLPDDTRLEWAFFGGGPEGLPVLVKVFGVLPGATGRVTEYTSGEMFLLARGIAKGEG